MIELSKEKPLSSESLVEVASEVHGCAREKGWWEVGADGLLVERDLDEMLMLAVTEVAEAAEEARKPDFDPARIYFRADGKPEGFSVELADLAIRCLDTTAARCGGPACLADSPFTRMRDLSRAVFEMSTESPISLLFILVGNLHDAADADDLKWALLDVTASAAGLSDALGGDFDRAMTLKMKYNRTRPHRHGGKRA